MNEERIFNVFKSIFSLDESVDRKSLIYNESAGWDSIGHMTLVAGLEEEFDCMFDTDDILDLSSFQKALEIMGKYSSD
ncbi:MAG: acyl carrier protein [Candidatus Azotimanducaceae bacterium]|jgi:acyl carrier protein